jgi:hypothetical protein
MEGLGARPFKCMRFFLNLGLMLRMVVPLLVRRELTASRTLRDGPTIATAGTNATSPERVPRRAATRNAFPAVLGLRTVFALGAVDLRFVLNGRLTFDMSGMWKRAKPAGTCPLDGRVRPIVSGGDDPCYAHDQATTQTTA